MPCEVALEAAHRLHAALALGFLALQVSAGLGSIRPRVIAMTCSVRLSWQARRASLNVVGTLSGEHPGEHFVGDHLGVNEHAVAVEDDQ